MTNFSTLKNRIEESDLPISEIKDNTKDEQNGQLFVYLNDGRSVSIVRRRYSFGAEDKLFEVDSPLRDEPIGYRTADDVMEILRKL